MGKYFTIEELCYSDTAIKKKIKNIPNDIETKRLEKLIEVLDEIREAWTIKCEQEKWGSPSIRVNSGFRSLALNTAIKGSKTSAHMLGYAADIEPSNQKNKEFWEFIIDYLKNNDIAWDQLINEKPRCGVPSWVHFGLKNKNGQQRRQIFTLV